MFRSITRGFSTTCTRSNKQFDQLVNAVKTETPQKSEVDDLLANVQDNSNANINNIFMSSSQGSYNDDIFGPSQVHPRYIAKNIRVNGPLAGRTVDVHGGKLSYGLSGINAIVRNNKIRYLYNVQSRFIPPAKYKKQLKREWWRNNFAKGFKELLGEVKDAKRRGY